MDTLGTSKQVEGASKSCEKKPDDVASCVPWPNNAPWLGHGEVQLE